MQMYRMQMYQVQQRWNPLNVPWYDVNVPLISTHVLGATHPTIIAFTTYMSTIIMVSSIIILYACTDSNKVQYQNCRTSSNVALVYDIITTVVVYTMYHEL